jgi:hypothetical protein
VVDSKRLEAMRDCFNVVANIPYKFEVCGDDYWQTPYETMVKGTGDCEDKSIYLQFLLRAKGIDSQVCFGKMEIEDKGYHAWVECINVYNIYVLDPTNMVFINRDYLKTGMYVKYDYLLYVLERVYKYEFFNDVVLNSTYEKMIKDVFNK